MKLFLFLLSFSACAQFSNQSELGLTMIRGNSVQNTLNLKTNNKFSFGKWATKLGASFNYGSAKKVVNTMNLNVQASLDRSLSENLDAFIATNRERNKFAGVIYKFATQGGIRYTFFKEEDSSLIGEFGGSRLIEKNIGKDSEVSYLARLAWLYEYKFNTSATVNLMTELLPNFTNRDNYFANAELSLTSMISETFSLKVSHLYNYRYLPPSGKLKEDQKTMASIVAKF
jgi:putative salt-induced outer membrane protein YdiY